MPVTQTRPKPRPRSGGARVGGDFALARLSDGRLVVGRGPFTRSARPSEEGACFYSNDFNLSVRRPWRIPAVSEVLASPDCLECTRAEPAPDLHWIEPSLEPFAAAFADIGKRLRRGEIWKAVPAVAARAQLRPGTDLGALLAGRALDPGSSSSLYGFSQDGRGFVGLSPERLFEVDGPELRTMALAGTAETGCDASFALDAKEQQEHLFVVEALRRRLDEFGAVGEGERRILDVGGMIHFISRFEVALHHKPSLDAVIEALHPTPAVGIVPRSKASLGYLDGLRAGLGVPPSFGAPFGVKLDEHFEAFVAIRGIFWSEREAFLPTGCGIVEGSRLESEWAELALKRRWVKSAFGLH